MEPAHADPMIRTGTMDVRQKRVKKENTHTGEHVCEQEPRDPRADGPTGFCTLVYGLVVVPMSLILFLRLPRAHYFQLDVGLEADPGWGLV